MLYRSRSQNFYDTNYRSDIFNQNNNIFNPRPKYAADALNKTMRTPKKVTQFTPNNYDPSSYYSNSPFAVEQKKRIALKKQNLPPKEKPKEYTPALVNYRKYGSIFDHYKQNFAMLKKKKETYLNNSANCSFKDHSPKEIKVMMNQSNILFNKQKDMQNRIYSKNVLSRSANISPRNKVVKYTYNTKQSTPKFYGRKKISFFTTNASVINLCDNKKQNRSINSSMNSSMSTISTKGTIHNYEIKKVKDTSIDFKEVQKIFNKKGINIYGIEYHDSSSFNNKDNCVIKVKERGDQFNTKIRTICREINKNPSVRINELNPHRKAQKITKQLEFSASQKNYY